MVSSVANFAARQRPHQRRLACVGVADQRDTELVAARGTALVAVALDILQLFFQLREAVAYLATIDFEIRLACAGPLLPPAAARFPQPRRDVFQPRHFDLQLRLAAMRMTVEYLDDHAGPVEHLRAGGTLEVAGLAWRDLVIDDHELRLPRRLRIGLLRDTGLYAAGVVKALAGLRLTGRRHRFDDACSACYRREFLKPPLAEHRATSDLVALLRHRADDLVT